MQEQLASELGEDVTLLPLVDLPPVWTEPTNRWIKSVVAAVGAQTGKTAQSPGCVPYFTDASVLTPALGDPPTVVLGPGEPGMAHQTDEYCFVDHIREAAAIYTRLIEQWRA